MQGSVDFETDGKAATNNAGVFDGYWTDEDASDDTYAHIANEKIYWHDGDVTGVVLHTAKDGSVELVTHVPGNSTLMSHKAHLDRNGKLIWDFGGVWIRSTLSWIRAEEQNRKFVDSLTHGSHLIFDKVFSVTAAGMAIVDSGKAFITRRKVQTAYQGVVNAQQVAAVETGQSVEDWPPRGEYIVRRLAAVNEDIHLNGRVVANLKPGMSVEVLETMESPAEDRLRARIADPPGYISLLAPSDPAFPWATPALPLFSESRRPVGTFVITSSVTVNDSISHLGGQAVGLLEPGTKVEVLQILFRLREQRIRALLREPRGYISLRQTDDVEDSISWAKPCVQEEERWP